jgi:hypothetical protein
MLRMRNLEMRSTRRGVGWIVAAATSGAVAVGGCWNAHDELFLSLTDPALATWGTGGSSTSTSTGDGGAPAGCVPSESADPVADSCGVFVSSSLGMDGNGGVKAAPAKTIGNAIEQAKSKGGRVYACAEEFAEAVTIAQGVTIYGGLDCTKAWAYVGATKKTAITADADAIPVMVMSTASGTAIYDVAITAVDAVKDGGSSIALLDDGAELLLARVDLVAGAGKAGTSGAPQSKVVTPATAKGIDGVDDPACTMAGPLAGGVGGTNLCGGTSTDGGNGGQGTASSVGGTGGDGVPFGANNGGVGESAASCDPGVKGTDGMSGISGTGARSAGALSASGYAAPLATTGGTGAPGRGGGGGGGGKQCDATHAGPSGGGGGAGGCGGLAGALGLSGGSSFGMVAIGAKLTLTSVTIATQNGGIGGVGGDGQPGGNGGLPGSAIGGGACGGGPGGKGGVGGPGGGGAGGHAVGLAIKGGTLPDLATTKITHGNGAVGGLGGNMDMTPQTKGDDGLGCATLDLTSPMSPACTK